MKTIEILKENKRAAKYIKEWFLERLATNIKNFKDDDDFKQVMSNTTVTDEQIENIISQAPRNILDILDSQGVLISIIVKDEKFLGDVFNARTEEKVDVNKHTTRKEFDVSAMKIALPLLEENLAAAENQEVVEDVKKDEEL